MDSITLQKRHRHAYMFFNDSLKIDTDKCIDWIYGKTRGGYGQMRIDKKSISVHREALRIHFGSPTKDKPHALHSCHNTSCFNYKHLRWGDRKENMDDKIKDGTYLFGESLPISKLNAESVKFIRENKGTLRGFAKMFGVSPSTIHSARHGDTWKNIQR